MTGSSRVYDLYQLRLAFGRKIVTGNLVNSFIRKNLYCFTPLLVFPSSGKQAVVAFHIISQNPAIIAVDKEKDQPWRKRVYFCSTNFRSIR